MNRQVWEIEREGKREVELNMHKFQLELYIIIKKITSSTVFSDFPTVLRENISPVFASN